MTPAAAQGPQTDPVTDSDSDSDPVTDSDSDPVTDSGSDPAQGPETETNPETNPETDAETNPGTETERPRLGMWALALVVAVIIAVLGVEAAVSSVHRKEYSKDRATTVFFLKNGSAISTSMERLEAVNDNDHKLLTGAASAIDTRNTLRFNRLVAQGEVNSDEQLQLQKQVVDYQEAFDKVFLR